MTVLAYLLDDQQKYKEQSGLLRPELKDTSVLVSHFTSLYKGNKHNLIGNSLDTGRAVCLTKKDKRQKYAFCAHRPL